MKAREIYVDPSALTGLFLHQETSRWMAVWRAKVKEPLLVTHHGRTEMTNALCRARFQNLLSESGLQEALADLDADFLDGRLVQANLLWRSALDKAGELSRNFTPELGTRSLDVLHVACALELKCRYFLTFDIRQQKLASRAGLKLLNLG